MRWAAFLNPDDHELIVLATTVIKRRGIFSAKRRQLILTEDAEGCSRIFYVDPTNLELKGSIPWSSDLHAEAAIKGHFRIHTPGRTYYLEDVAGDQATAELWVQTISKIQARLLQGVHHQDRMKHSHAGVGSRRGGHARLLRKQRQL